MLEEVPTSTVIVVAVEEWYVLERDESCNEMDRVSFAPFPSLLLAPIATWDPSLSMDTEYPE